VVVRGLPGNRMRGWCGTQLSAGRGAGVSRLGRWSAADEEAGRQQTHSTTAASAAGNRAIHHSATVKLQQQQQQAGRADAHLSGTCSSSLSATLPCRGTNPYCAMNRWLV
jgi:hypothetical protein